MELLEPVPDYGTKNVPICLPMSEVAPKNLVFTGWGMTYDPASGGRSSEILKETNFEPITDAKCKSWWQQIDTKTQICAGSRMNIAYNVDFGGPLATVEGGRTHQVGIASFAPKDCGTVSQHPNGFTKVAPYSSWILDTVGAVKPNWCRGGWIKQG